MNNEEQNLTKEDKSKRLAALKALIETEGWRLVQAELDNDLRITEGKLLGDVAMSATEDVESLKRERIDRLELRNLPENLILELSEEDAETPNLDVYEE